jgi:hypothetical protein
MPMMTTMTSAKCLAAGGVADVLWAGVSAMDGTAPWAVITDLSLGVMMLGVSFSLAMHLPRGEDGRSRMPRRPDPLRSARVELGKTMTATKERNDRANVALEQTTKTLNDLVESVKSAMDQVEKGPSLGASPDGSGGYVGLFAADYFEPYAVCPACGLEALHWIYAPAPDEGHDKHTSMLKYWSAQNAEGHAMRDYECIRTCLSCEVHWGQNALGIFPAPMLGPFRRVPNPERVKFRAVKQIAEDREASRVTPEPLSGQVEVMDAEPDEGDVVDIDRLLLLPTAGGFHPDGEVMPALARPKDTAKDRQVYREHDGKLVVVVNGFVMARKGINGTWSVPINPTRWAGAPATQPGTDLVTAEEGAELRQQFHNKEEWAREYWDAQEFGTGSVPGNPVRWTEDALASSQVHKALAKRRHLEGIEKDIETVMNLMGTSRSGATNILEKLQSQLDELRKEMNLPPSGT